MRPKSDCAPASSLKEHPGDGAQAVVAVEQGLVIAVETDEDKRARVADAPSEIRRGPGFITKVYGILCMQMVMIVGVAVLFMFEPNVHTFVLSSPNLSQAAGGP